MCHLLGQSAVELLINGEKGIIVYYHDNQAKSIPLTSKLGGREVDIEGAHHEQYLQANQALAGASSAVGGNIGSLVGILGTSERIDSFGFKAHSINGPPAAISSSPISRIREIDLPENKPISPRVKTLTVSSGLEVDETIWKFVSDSQAMVYFGRPGQVEGIDNRMVKLPADTKVVMRISKDSSPGLDMFLRHVILKIMDDYFLKEGIYTVNHISLPLGYFKNSYYYLFTEGSEGWPTVLIDMNSPVYSKTPVMMEEYHAFKGYLYCWGFDIWDIVDSDGDGGKNIIHRDWNISRLYETFQLSKDWVLIDLDGLTFNKEKFFQSAGKIKGESKRHLDWQYELLMLAAGYIGTYPKTLLREKMWRLKELAQRYLDEVALPQILPQSKPPVSSSPIHRIGILTGGGPASGHNEVIASVVEEATKHNLTVIGIMQGWKGLVDEQVLKSSKVLTLNQVLPYRTRGGTIIGTSRTNPYNKKSIEAGIPALLWENIHKLKLDALITCGGDDTNSVSNELFKDHPDFALIGMPKTMDNDIALPEPDAATYGYDSFVTEATRLLESGIDDAICTQRVLVVDVFGRNAGFVALGVGANVKATRTLIPEEKNLDLKKAALDIANYYKVHKYGVVVISEGVRVNPHFKDNQKALEDAFAKDLIAKLAFEKGSEELDSFGHPKLQHAGLILAAVLKNELKAYKVDISLAGKMDYLVRSAPTSKKDLHMCHLLGQSAVELLINGEKGIIVYYHDNQAKSIPLTSKLGGREVDIEGAHHEQYLQANQALAGASSAVGSLVTTSLSIKKILGLGTAFIILFTPSYLSQKADLPIPAGQNYQATQELYSSYINKSYILIYYVLRNPQIPYKSDLLGEATLYLKKARSLNPVNNPKIFNYLGLIAYLNDEFSLAVRYLEKAISLKPDYPVYYNDLGGVYYSLGDYLCAREAFDKAIRLDKDYYLAYKNRAFVLFQLRDYQGAYEDIEIYKGLNPIDFNNDEVIQNLKNEVEKQLNIDSVRSSSLQDSYSSSPIVGKTVGEFLLSLLQGKIKAIIFDFDGIIAKSIGIIEAAYTEVFFDIYRDINGISPVNYELINLLKLSSSIFKANIGMPTRATLLEVIYTLQEENKARALRLVPAIPRKDPKPVEEYEDSYIQRTLRKIADTNPEDLLMDGAEEVIKKLSNSGLLLYIASAGNLMRVGLLKEKILTALSLSDSFRSILCTGSADKKIQAISGILENLKQENIGTGEVLFVDDSYKFIEKMRGISAFSELPIVHMSSELENISRGARFKNVIPIRRLKDLLAVLPGSLVNTFTSSSPIQAQLVIDLASNQIIQRPSVTGKRILRKEGITEEKVLEGIANGIFKLIPEKEYIKLLDRSATGIGISGGGDCAGIADFFRSLRYNLKSGLTMLGVRNAGEGLMDEDFLNRLILVDPLLAEDFSGQSSTPYGSSREDPLKKNKEITQKNLSGFKFFYGTGGNDHLGLLERFSKLLPELVVVGTFKSIDGDGWVAGRPAQMLGFHTAAGVYQRQLWAIIQNAYTHKQWHVVETFGRGCGKLAYASGRRYPDNFSGLPKEEQRKIIEFRDMVMIVVPEKPTSLRSIAEEARRIKKEEGGVAVVVAEGFMPPELKSEIIRLGSDESLRDRWFRHDLPVESISSLIHQGERESPTDDLSRLLQDPELAAQFAKTAWQAKFDPHGNATKLAGITNFVVKALEVLGGSSKVNRILFNYEARGATPDLYDIHMGEKIGAVAARIINNNIIGGKAVVYFEEMDPLEEEPEVVDLVGVSDKNNLNNPDLYSEEELIRNGVYWEKGASSAVRADDPVNALGPGSMANLILKRISGKNRINAAHICATVNFLKSNFKLPQDSAESIVWDEVARMLKEGTGSSSSSPLEGEYFFEPYVMVNKGELLRLYAGIDRAAAAFYLRASPYKPLPEYIKFIQAHVNPKDGEISWSQRFKDLTWAVDRELTGLAGLSFKKQLDGLHNILIKYGLLDGAGWCCGLVAASLSRALRELGYLATELYIIKGIYLINGRTTSHLIDVIEDQHNTNNNLYIDFGVGASDWKGFFHLNSPVFFSSPKKTVSSSSIGLSRWGDSNSFASPSVAGGGQRLLPGGASKSSSPVGQELREAVLESYLKPINSMIMKSGVNLEKKEIYRNLNEQAEQLVRERDSGSQKALEELILIGMALVAYNAQWLKAKSGSEEVDIVQDCFYAVQKAAVRYRLERGASFKTYLFNGITKFLLPKVKTREHGNGIKLPKGVDVIKAVFFIKKLLEGELGREPTLKEIVVRANSEGKRWLTESRAKHILNTNFRNHVRMDAPVSDGNGDYLWSGRMSNEQDILSKVNLKIIEEKAKSEIRKAIEGYNTFQKEKGRDRSITPLQTSLLIYYLIENYSFEKAREMVRKEFGKEFRTKQNMNAQAWKIVKDLEGGRKHFFDFRAKEKEFGVPGIFGKISVKYNRSPLGKAFSSSSPVATLGHSGTLNRDNVSRLALPAWQGGARSPVGNRTIGSHPVSRESGKLGDEKIFLGNDNVVLELSPYYRYKAEFRDRPVLFSYYVKFKGASNKSQHIFIRGNTLSLWLDYPKKNLEIISLKTSQDSRNLEDIDSAIFDFLRREALRLGWSASFFCITEKNEGENYLRRLIRKYFKKLRVASREGARYSYKLRPWDGEELKCDIIGFPKTDKEARRRQTKGLLAQAGSPVRSNNKIPLIFNPTGKLVYGRVEELNEGHLGLFRDWDNRFWKSLGKLKHFSLEHVEILLRYQSDTYKTFVVVTELPGFNSILNSRLQREIRFISGDNQIQGGLNITVSSKYVDFNLLETAPWNQFSGNKFLSLPACGLISYAYANYMNSFTRRLILRAPISPEAMGLYERIFNKRNFKSTRPVKDLTGKFDIVIEKEDVAGFAAGFGRKYPVPPDLTASSPARRIIASEVKIPSKISSILSSVVKGKDSRRRIKALVGMLSTNLSVDHFVTWPLKFYLSSAVYWCAGIEFCILLTPVIFFSLGGIVRLLLFAGYKLVWRESVRMNKFGLAVTFIPEIGNLAPIAYVLSDLAKERLAEIIYFTKDVDRISTLIETSVSKYANASNEEIKIVLSQSLSLAEKIYYHQDKKLKDYNYRRFKIRGTKDYSLERVFNLIKRQDLSDMFPADLRLRSWLFKKAFNINLPGYKKGTRPILIIEAARERRAFKYKLVETGTSEEFLSRIYYFDISGFSAELSKGNKGASRANFDLDTFIKPMFANAGSSSPVNLAGALNHPFSSSPLTYNRMLIPQLPRTHRKTIHIYENILATQERLSRALAILNSLRFELRASAYKQTECLGALTEARVILGKMRGSKNKVAEAHEITLVRQELDLMLKVLKSGRRDELLGSANRAVDLLEARKERLSVRMKSFEERVKNILPLLILLEPQVPYDARVAQKQPSVVIAAGPKSKINLSGEIKYSFYGQSARKFEDRIKANLSGLLNGRSDILTAEIFYGDHKPGWRPKGRQELIQWLSRYYPQDPTFEEKKENQLWKIYLSVMRRTYFDVFINGEIAAKFCRIKVTESRDKTIKVEIIENLSSSPVNPRIIIADLLNVLEVIKSRRAKNIFSSEFNSIEEIAKETRLERSVVEQEIIRVSRILEQRFNMFLSFEDIKGVYLAARMLHNPELATRRNIRTVAGCVSEVIDSVLPKKENEAEPVSLAKLASEYDEIARSGWENSGKGTYAVIYRDYRRYIADIVGRGKNILSNGCGTGELEELLIAQGNRVSGLDISREMVKEFKSRCPSAEARIANASTDLSGLFGENIFDVVIFPESIGHMNIPVALQESYRVLKEGGLLIITTYEPSNMLNNWLSQSYRRLYSPVLAKIVEDAHFKVVKKETLDFEDAEDQRYYLPGGVIIIVGLKGNPRGSSPQVSSPLGDELGVNNRIYLHGTSVENLASIIKDGLILPKTYSNKYHKPVTYLSQPAYSQPGYFSRGVLLYISRDRLIKQGIRYFRESDTVYSVSYEPIPLNCVVDVEYYRVIKDPLLLREVDALAKLKGIVDDPAYRENRKWLNEIILSAKSSSPAGSLSLSRPRIVDEIKGNYFVCGSYSGFWYVGNSMARTCKACALAVFMDKDKRTYLGHIYFDSLMDKSLLKDWKKYGAFAAKDIFRPDTKVFIAHRDSGKLFAGEIEKLFRSRGLSAITIDPAPENRKIEDMTLFIWPQINELLVQYEEKSGPGNYRVVQENLYRLNNDFELLQISSSPLSASYERYTGLVAGSTEKWSKIWQVIRLPQSEFMGRLLGQNSFKSGDNVLSLGCGRREDELILARDIGCLVTATDISPVCINRIAQEAQKQGISDKFAARIQDLSKRFDFPDEEFDAILASCSLISFDGKTMGRIVDEIWRVLKPGGRIFAIVYSQADKKYGRGWPLDKDLFNINGMVYRFFDRESLEIAFKGFTDIIIKNAKVRSLEGEWRKMWELQARKPEFSLASSSPIGARGARRDCPLAIPEASEKILPFPSLRKVNLAFKVNNDFELEILPARERVVPIERELSDLLRLIKNSNANAPPDGLSISVVSNPKQTNGKIASFKYYPHNLILHSSFFNFIQNRQEKQEAQKEAFLELIKSPLVVAKEMLEAIREPAFRNSRGGQVRVEFRVKIDEICIGTLDWKILVEAKGFSRINNRVLIYAIRAGREITGSELLKYVLGQDFWGKHKFSSKSKKAVRETLKLFKDIPSASSPVAENNPGYILREDVSDWRVVGVHPEGLISRIGLQGKGKIRELFSGFKNKLDILETIDDLRIFDEQPYAIDQSMGWIKAAEFTRRKEFFAGENFIIFGCYLNCCVANAIQSIAAYKYRERQPGAQFYLLLSITPPNAGLDISGDKINRITGLFREIFAGDVSRYDDSLGPWFRENQKAGAGFIRVNDKIHYEGLAKVKLENLSGPSILNFIASRKNTIAEQMEEYRNYFYSSLFSSSPIISKAEKLREQIIAGLSEENCSLGFFPPRASFTDYFIPWSKKSKETEAALRQLFLVPVLGLLSIFSLEETPEFPFERFFTPVSIPLSILRTLGDEARRTKLVLEFLKSIEGREPEWFTPNRIINKGRGYWLRDFSVSGYPIDPQKTPVLIIPPNAGHSSTVADFGDNKSIVQTYLRLGYPVYALDWQSATPDNIQIISDLIKSVKDSIVMIGGNANLAGLCQGGWVAVATCALYPELVRSLLLGAAPIDTARGCNAITLTSKAPVELVRWLVHGIGRPNVQDGETQGEGFYSTMPLGLKKLKMWNDLMADIYDPQKMKERDEPFQVWFRKLYNISLWIIEAFDELFKNNKLFKSELKILDGDEFRRVDLSQIKCPVGLLEGSEDDITALGQTFALADVIGTPKEHILKKLIAGVGHIGVFNGRDSQESWQRLMLFIESQLASSAASSPVGAYSVHGEILNIVLALAEAELGIQPQELLKGKIMNIGLESRLFVEAGCLCRERLAPANLVTYLSASGLDIVGLDPQINFTSGNRYVRGEVQDMHMFQNDNFDRIISFGLFDIVYKKPFGDYRIAPKHFMRLRPRKSKGSLRIRAFSWWTYMERTRNSWKFLKNRILK
jgi:6-phosphofructokinase/ubiquinone/menaquinone biosynthesis C-methylase UbiE/poly-beta-hydroxyalkanoate depolymerase/phosphoglycolate phosphatase-like HAD superfamily hydrolase/DNA-directed RNA polymerase specialized sigma subunit